MISDTSNTTPSTPDAVAQLDVIVDAVCQGRLVAAEIAGLTTDELDAIYALGQARLHTGQVDAAVMLWQALVALDPYQARSWRALGIGHHHAGAMRQAAAAYNAALYLEPDDALTCVYAAEAYMLLGEHAHAQRLVARVQRSDHAEALSRLAEVLAAIPQAPASSPGPAPADAPNTTPLELLALDDAQGFCLADGRLLPLVDSIYPPAGESDETTLVFDLAQATQASGTASTAKASANALDASTDANAREVTHGQTQVPTAPAVSAAPNARSSGAKERTLTRSLAPLAALLPEATAARRKGRMLTEEITISPAPDTEQEVTQSQISTPGTRSR